MSSCDKKMALAYGVSMISEQLIRFERAKDYRIVGSTGVWGGINPQGEVFFDFFVDRREPPQEITLEVIDGTGKEQERKGGTNIIRELQVGVLLHPRTAYSIGTWLMEMAKATGYAPLPEDTQEQDEGI
jgi:hypothetical protein